MMKILKRFAAFALLLPCAAISVNAVAEVATEFPARPIKLVVPFPAGGPTDLLARVVGQRMGELMRQTIVIDNKPGANTIIGASAVAKAAPDGYTLLLAIDNTLVMNQHLYSRLPYDPVKDFEPIGKVATTPLVVMTNQAGPKSMQALVDQAKTHPSTMSYGFGTFTSQLSGELLRKFLGKDVVPVSYKGSAGTTQALLSSDVAFTIDGITTAMPHFEKGTLRPLARLSAKPIPTLPKVPSLAEAGINLPDIEVWMALLAPKGTPSDVVAKLNRALTQALAAKDVQDTLLAAGLLTDPSSPEALRSFMTSESASWRKVIADSGIKID
ncbi:tripartite tricarboxylate transporter substrate binding protein [Variovorax sp. J31P207]|uniref:Bug family tripartite tricarboxylate transporter substrate binding protein n=1 Tax=Variovorax sp. J31P207 TaxID=3053510 RepID=UPI00257819E8|nr:tripartite tricarboxylate transporter substrate binding protein [Variovorax sp. J31P207]MDM0066895.1 tripartite tricarboxylate transporter substrate binding protein [Variovorax sp. J31P207]